MSLLQNSNAIEAGGYPISNSLRFQSASSQYATRTFATSGTSNTIKTFSFWVKRGSLGSRQSMFGGYDGSSGNNFQIEWESTDTLQLFFGGAAAYEVTTTQVFRDPSAWYHIVATFDTTQATASNRYKLYVNGTQVTAFGTANYPPQNSTVQFGLNNGNNRIGTWWNASTAMLDGYLTEVNFIDGQALTPSSFGETNTLTGQWVAKKYTGTYGTNGFYLPFSNGTSTTTLGADSSGNGNNWTLTNFTRSAGVSDCWMYDVPSGNGGASGTQPNSNYCVLNPLNTGLAPSNANLNLNRPTASWVSAGSTIQTTSGKWYFEAFMSTIGSGNYIAVGLKVAGAVGVEYGGQVANSWAVLTNSTNLSTYTNNVSTNATVISATTSMAFQVAVDFDAGKIWFGYNNTWLASGNPSTGANPTYTFTANTELQAILSAYANNNAINFGQRSFAYTPPSGFKALCTANLPAPTIAKGNQYMDATLWSGNSTARSITNAAGFSPDLVWIKNRSSTDWHIINDAVRGVPKNLYSNTTNAEDTGSYVTALNSDGFSLSTSAGVNGTGSSYVGWQWDAGSSTVTNTSGTISSQVRANATAGVSVVTATKTGSPQTVGHGLGVKPAMIIVKNRASASDWIVAHKSLNMSSEIIILNSTAAKQSVSWGGEPTSSVFYVSNSMLGNNDFVAYCFAEIAGFSKFGSYTGNGSADGVFVYTGFRPKFVLLKITSTTGDWYLFDTSRSPYNVAGERLCPDLSAAEATGSAYYLDMLSNGFKLRNTSTELNGSGATFIYACFAENPLANSNAR